jgi:KGK domain
MDNEIKIDGISEKSAIAFDNGIVKCSQFIQASNDYMSDQSSLDKLSVAFDKGIVTHGVSVLCQGEEWVNNGIKCEVLQPETKDWQKGVIKMKISLSFEFQPTTEEISLEKEEETIESPLDAIRQMA